MAGAFGYRFIFASVIFYSFLGYLLSSGFSTYLTASIPALSTIGSPGDNILLVAANFLTAITIIFTNPLTAYGFLAWLSTGILITDIYIIVTSVIP